MSDGSHHHLSILVVEDEALIRWSIVETLAQHGHRVIEAGDASAAVRALSETPGAIDVVLLDYRLPDSNDLRLLQNIRRLRPDSAVVMMTAFKTAEVMNSALELGVYRVLNKPFDLGALESVILEAHEAHSNPGPCSIDRSSPSRIAGG